MMFRKMRFAAAAIVSISTFTSKDNAFADDWITYQHDSNHTGRSSALFDPSELVKSWSAPQGYSQPVVVGDKVFSMRNQQGVGNDVTSVSSFQLNDGTINWTYSNQFVFPGQPTLAEGLVLFVARRSMGTTRLYALDAVSGSLRYTVPLGGASSSTLMPTVARNSNGDLVAYVLNGNALSAVRLGENSGSILWTGGGSFGGASIPTICEDSIILAGPGQFYAFDQLTGAVNHFVSADFSGGGGTTVACDSERHQFYIAEKTNSVQSNPLTAFSITDYSHITQLWQQTGPGIGHGASVAIGQNGNIYSASGSTLLELDPSTGAILRSLAGLSLASSITPAVTGNAIFLMAESQINVYDLQTLTLRATLQGSRGSLNTPYDSPGAVFDTGFALDHGNIYGRPGFDLFRVPEPSTIWLLLLFGVRTSRRHRP